MIQYLYCRGRPIGVGFSSIMDDTITILVADDHQLLRSALRTLLENQPDMRVVGEAANGRSAVEAAAELSPDVVVMDVNMPDLDGIQATRAIRAGGDGPRVIGLSALGDRRHMLEMFQAGATGYVFKTGAFEELARAVRTVAKAQLYVSSAVADVVVQECLRGATSAGSVPASAIDRLSEREREILKLIAEGRSTKEVAFALSVSVKTVETHRRNLMEKLGVDSVAGLTSFAVAEGLAPL
jgi:DNA-binding NarL/FixJ family response regulator